MKNIIENLKREIARLEELAVQETTVPEQSDKVQLSTLTAGDTFHIGEQEFIVLEHGMEGTCIISKGCIGERRVFDDETKDYGESSLRGFMDETVLPMLEKEVGAENLVEHEVELTSVDMQNEFDSIRCKVRPLTFDEARKYNDLLVNKDLPGWYWTCTPWSTEERGWEYSMAVVSPSGDIGGGSCDDSSGVRPFCILKSNIFVSR